MQRATSPWVRGYRLIVAVAILAAVLAIFPPLAGGGSIVAYLSYFTIQSNLIAAVVLPWGGYPGVLVYALAITAGVLVFMRLLFVSGRGMRRMATRG